MINPAFDVDYALVAPTLNTAATPTEVHIISHQLTRLFEWGTTYDNGVLQGRPYTAALYLPAAVSKEEIIRDAGKVFFCPPHLPTAVCTCWHGGVEWLSGQRFPNRNGPSCVLNVHRQLREDFWDDAETLVTNLEASGSVNFRNSWGVLVFKVGGLCIRLGSVDGH